MSDYDIKKSFKMRIMKYWVMEIVAKNEAIEMLMNIVKNMEAQ